MVATPHSQDMEQGTLKRVLLPSLQGTELAQFWYMLRDIPMKSCCLLTFSRIKNIFSNLHYYHLSMVATLCMLAKESLEASETATGLKSPSALWRKSDKYQTLDLDPLPVFPPCLKPHCHHQSQQKQSFLFPRGGEVPPQPQKVMMWEKILVLDSTSITIRGYILEVGGGWWRG